MCSCIVFGSLTPTSSSIGIWILGLAMFPVLVLWLNTESLLLFIQQDPCVARYITRNDVSNTIVDVVLYSYAV